MLHGSHLPRFHLDPSIGMYSALGRASRHSPQLGESVDAVHFILLRVRQLLSLEVQVISIVASNVIIAGTTLGFGGSNVITQAMIDYLEGLINA